MILCSVSAQIVEFIRLAGGDAAITIPGGDVVTSSGFGPLRGGRYPRAPKWYRMNHRRIRPNVAPRFLNESTREVVWVTIRPVRAGEELVYAYDNVPREWG